jgi:hypothetical protein
VGNIEKTINNNPLEAYHAANSFFDEQEDKVRRSCEIIVFSAQVGILIMVILLLSYIRIFKNMMPDSIQNKATIIVYTTFLFSLFLYPVVYFMYPKIVEISYLFRKEYFLQKFIDKYNLNIEKPIFVKEDHFPMPIAIVPFILVKKILISKSLITRVFVFIVNTISRVNPIKEIQKYA